MIPTLDFNWNSLLWNALPWILPLGAALFLLFIGPFLKSGHRFYFGYSLLAGLATLVLAWQYWQKATGEAAGLFLFDPVTYLFVILFAVAFLLTLLLSYNYLESFGLVRPEYYALLLFALFGMACIAAGHDLMVIFLGIEIMSIAVYILAGFQRSNILCVEASLKYFLIGAFASAFLLLGIAFLYGASGTTDLISFHQLGAQVMSGEMRLFGLIGLSLLAVGLAFKIAVVPFHFWVADVYEGAPIVVTTFMATAVKMAGFAALLRVTWALFHWAPELLTNIIWIAAFLTMTVGNLAALVQKSVKRMLAYSSIAHAGYALIPLVAFAKNDAAVVSAIAFYLLAYTLMTVGAFAVLISLTGEGKENCSFQDLAGLGFKKPFLGFVMTLFMISLAGIPPTIGFFGKYYLFIQAIDAGFIGLVVVAVLNSVISVYYYLSPVVAMYFGKEEGPLAWAPTQGVLAVLWLTAMAVLFLGLFPSTLLNLFQSSANAWLVATH